MKAHESYAPVMLGRAMIAAAIVLVILLAPIIAHYWK